MKSRSIIGSTALMFATSVLLSACGGKTVDKNAAAATPPPPSVVVAQVSQQTVPIYSEFVGQTKAKTTIEIRARVQGMLERILFTEGAPVKKGQVLFQIQKSEFEAAIASAKAAVDKSQADLDQVKQRTDVISAEAQLAQTMTALRKAKSDLDRYVPLAKENAVTQVDLDTVKAAEESARAEVTASEANLKNKQDAITFNIAKANAALASARADLAQAQLNLGYCTIVSPIDGVIGLQQVNVGNLVGKNDATLLATVSSANPIYVDFNIGEAFLLHLVQANKRGSRANVGFKLLLSDNTVYEREGHFTVVDRAVDTATGTIVVRATFVNVNNRLRPGQFARVRVAAEERADVLLVPQIAIQELQSAKYVLVVGDDNKVVQRTVKTGDRFEESIIVLEGLQAGERVITTGIQKVRPGMVVKPTVAGGA